LTSAINAKISPDYMLACRSTSKTLVTLPLSTTVDTSLPFETDEITIASKGQGRLLLLEGKVEASHQGVSDVDALFMAVPKGSPSKEVPPHKMVVTMQYFLIKAYLVVIS